MKNRNDLFSLIKDHFDMSELRTLSFNLAIDWDELPGDRKSVKIVSLLRAVSQDNRQNELLEYLIEQRPHIDWPNIDAHTLQPSSRDKDIRVRQVLIKKVRDYWIEGVYKKSLFMEAKLELGLTYQHDSVQRPWMLTLQSQGMEEPPELIPINTEIIDIT
jgi:hypothetical protein